MVDDENVSFGAVWRAPAALQLLTQLNKSFVSEFNRDCFGLFSFGLFTDDLKY